MLTFILSLPRSGSTVLTSLLDRRKGVVCPPESSFPQVLGEISRAERTDRRNLAAIYIASTFPGTPLSLEEATDCMEGSDKEILEAIGRKLAAKLGRDPDAVQSVVWKTTRTIGMNRAPLQTGGRFVVLRRHPHNVFESQFRVHFGKNNRAPWRFAGFRASYEHAFASLPKDRLFELGYDRIPDLLGELTSFIGIGNPEEWDSGSSSLEAVARDRPWLTEIMDTFENKDPEKRARIEPEKIVRLDRAIEAARMVTPLLGPIRRLADMRTLGHIRQRAKRLLAEAS